MDKLSVLEAKYGYTTYQVLFIVQDCGLLPDGVSQEVADQWIKEFEKTA